MIIRPFLLSLMMAAPLVPASVALAASVPMPERIAIEKSALPSGGEQIEQIFNVDAGSLFSATIDALVAINAPIRRVEAAHGVIESDWINPAANNFEGRLGAIGSPTRYRLECRIERSDSGSRLLVTTYGQRFFASQWHDETLQRKFGPELFSAVADQLAPSTQP